MRDPRDVIRRQIVTEKTAEQEAEQNQYTFEVSRDANKHEIRHAIEKLFSVHVSSVRTQNIRGKWRRQGFQYGKKPNWKKAVVQIAPGEIIDIE